MEEDVVAINRAPVLTLWAAVVAERLGHDREAALTLGRALAGLNAQAKGRRLGIFQAPEPAAAEPPRMARPREEIRVPLLGRPVPATGTPEGLRAVVGDEPIDPLKVEQYLERSFGESLAAARDAMESLAAALSPETLEHEANGLYERFRPKVASGRAGWGQKSTLDLGLIRSLARQGRR